MDNKNGTYSRAQLRQAERVQQEAEELHQVLCGKFVHFFMNNDPDGVEVQDKVKELSAKWKAYCHSKKIKTEFHGSIDQYCKKYITDFNKERGPRIAIDYKFMFEEIDAKLHKIPSWIRKIFKAA